MGLHLVAAVKLVGDVGVVVVTCGQECGLRVVLLLLARCGVFITEVHHLPIGTAAVDEVIHHILLCGVVDGPCAHPVEYPEGVEVVGETHRHVTTTLVVVLALVGEVTHRDVVLINHLDDVVVHIGILVIDGDTTREHIAQNHPLRAVAHYRFVTLRGIVALHCAGNAHKLFDVLLPLAGGHHIVAPVVDQTTHHKHNTAGTRKVVFGAEVGGFEGVEHCGYRLATENHIIVEQVVECVELHFGGYASHLGIVAEAVVGDGCLFLGSARHRGLFDAPDDGASIGGVEFFHKGRDVAPTEEYPRVLGWGQGNGGATNGTPHNLVRFALGQHGFVRVVVGLVIPLRFGLSASHAEERHYRKKYSVHTIH